MLAMNDASDQPREPKLLDRVGIAVRTRRLSRRTEDAYVGWIRRFILFHRKRHLREMGADEVGAFAQSTEPDFAAVSVTRK